jgi:hypothetical protein
MLKFNAETRQAIAAEVRRVFGESAEVWHCAQSRRSPDKVVVAVQDRARDLGREFSTHIVYLGSGRVALNHGRYDLSAADLDQAFFVRVTEA